MAYVLSNKGVRALTKIVNGGRKSTGTTYSASPVNRSDYPLPFEVRWNSKVNSEQGGWVIYLPEGDILYYDNEPINVLSATGGAADPLPEGWYLLEDFPTSNAADVLLVITLRDMSLEILPEEPEETDGKEIYRIASVTRDDTKKKVTIQQYLRGTLYFHNASDRYPEPFEYTHAKSETEGEPDTFEVEGGSFYFDGEEQTIDEPLPLSGQGGETAYLVCTEVISAAGTSWGFALQSTPSASTHAINVRLYDFVDGEVAMDYRGVNLPIYSGGDPNSYTPPMEPFPYAVTAVDPQTGEVVSGEVSGDSFYFNGALVTVPGALTIPGQGTENCYIRCVPDNTHQGETTLTFSLGTAPSAVSGAINIQIYSFLNGKVSADYRGVNLPYTEPPEADWLQPFHFDGTQVLADSFFFDGETKTVTQPLAVPSQGPMTAYLNCTKTTTAQGASWSFELSNSAVSSSGSIAVKLYDFANGEVITDYRGVNLPVSTGGNYDDKSLEKNSNGIAQLKGYDSPPSTTDTVGNLLTASTQSADKIIVRGDDGTLRYIPIGHVTAGGSAVNLSALNGLTVLTGLSLTDVSSDKVVRATTKTFAVTTQGNTTTVTLSDGTPCDIPTVELSTIIL